MNKKLLLVVLAVLALLIVPMSPAIAVTRVPMTFTITGLVQLDPGRVWTAGHITHTKGRQVVGVYSSPQLGTGTFEATMDRRYSLLTGEGTYLAKAIITITVGGSLGLGTGTISGTGEAKITGSTQLSGKAVYTHGTGGLAGVRKWAEFATVPGGTAGAGTIAY